MSTLDKYKATLWQAVGDRTIREVLGDVAKKLLALAVYAYERRMAIEAMPVPTPASDPWPDGAILTFTGAACPAGWTLDTRFSGRMPKGAWLDPDITPDPPNWVMGIGETGGEQFHSHTMVYALPTPSGGSKQAQSYTGTVTMVTSDDHTHDRFGLTITTDEAEATPPFISVLFCRKGA